MYGDMLLFIRQRVSREALSQAKEASSMPELVHGSWGGPHLIKTSTGINRMLIRLRHQDLR